MSQILVEFKDSYGQLHALNQELVAPINSARHTYKLVWGSDDHYQILLDSELLIEGPISGHFQT
jgi:hypothetical protein